MDIYRLWRPTPLYRARRLEKALDTPAHIYYKYEGTSPAGSHKPNTAVAQAYYNKQAGIKRLATETGAGQWGSALSLACQHVRPGVHRLHGAGQLRPEALPPHDDEHLGRARSSPARATAPTSGRAVLAAHPDSPGSLGIAISEAVEDAATHADTNYALGSVLNHVMLHQTVIGQEAKQQMAMAGEEPDVVIGCFGGGSNFGGIALPYVLGQVSNGTRAAHPGGGAGGLPHASPRASSPTISATPRKLTPLIKMYTLGHDFVPPGHPRRRPALSRRVAAAEPPAAARLDRGAVVHATARVRSGGAVRADRRHSAGAGIRRTPSAPRSTKRSRPAKKASRATILFCLSGHGHFDLASYDAYLSRAAAGLRAPRRGKSPRPWSRCRNSPRAGRAVLRPPGARRAQV